MLHPSRAESEGFHHEIADKTTEILRESEDRLEATDVHITKEAVAVVWPEYGPNTTYGMDNSDISLYTRSDLLPVLPRVNRISNNIYDSALPGARLPGRGILLSIGA